MPISSPLLLTASFLLSELAAQAFGQDFGVLELGARQDDGEFLAAVTGDAAGIAHRLGQDRGEDLQDFVADRMAKGVIDLLKVVDVPHHQARALPEACAWPIALARLASKPRRLSSCVGLAQAHRLRLGKVECSLSIWLLECLEPGLEVGGLVLHRRILRNQKLDNDADLFGGGQARQAPVGLRQQTEYLS